MNKSIDVAGVRLMISGDLPEGTLAGAEAYMTGENPPECADVLSINCRVEEHIPAKELKELYGVRHFIEEYGMTEDGPITQDRGGDASFATMTYSPDFRKAECRLVDVESDGGGSLASRMNVALGRCLLNALPTFGGLTFHSSAITYEGWALLFAAPSGTGKSTQTGLWRRYYPAETSYINDDTPIIRRKDGALHAFGSPWAGTSGINGNISAPIKAIIYVERGSDNSLRGLNPTERLLRAMCAVREQLFPLPAELQNALVFEVAEEIPAYVLSCDISRGAVEAVKSRLFGLC